MLNENKACYFKHDSKEECAGSRNYTSYTTKTSQFESLKHRVGKAIIKDQLQASLEQYGAKVMDGYYYRLELNYVPDIIVEWPRGDVWTFDYVTGTKSAQYQRYLMNKQKDYINKSFKSYFLFDLGQIAYRPEQRALALSVAEKGSLQFLLNNLLWEGLLQDLKKRYGRKLLATVSRLVLKDMSVQRLMYVTDDIDGMLYNNSSSFRSDISRYSGSVVYGYRGRERNIDK